MPLETGGRDEAGGASVKSGGLSQTDRYERAWILVQQPIREQHRVDGQAAPPMGTHSYMIAVHWNKDYPLLYIHLYICI